MSRKIKHGSLVTGWCERDHSWIPMSTCSGCEHYDENSGIDVCKWEPILTGSSEPVQTTKKSKAALQSRLKEGDPMEPQSKYNTPAVKPQACEIDLNQFARWQAEDTDNRSVTIKIDRRVNPETKSDVEIWVTQWHGPDPVCQQVWNVAEINVEELYVENLLEKLKSIKRALGMDD